MAHACCGRSFVTPIDSAEPERVASRWHAARAAAGALFVALCASPAMAEDFRASVVEGAPRDRFILEHLGSCRIERVVVTIDFSGAPTGVYFDVTPNGAGLNVSQPVQIIEGAGHVAETPAVLDGDQTLVLTLRDLEPGVRVVLTGDLDDVAPTSIAGRTRIGGDEILGSVLRARVGDRERVADFTSSGVATLPLCPAGVS